YIRFYLLFFLRLLPLISTLFPYTTLFRSLDYKIYDQTNLWFLGCMQGAYNMTTDVKKTWSEDNPGGSLPKYYWADQLGKSNYNRSEEHTSELQSRFDLVCRLLLEKKKIKK